MQQGSMMMQNPAVMMASSGGFLSAQPATHGSMSGTARGAAATANPLFGSAPSPLGSAGGPGAPATLNPTAGGGAGNDAEMMQRLMGEIMRLKGELGDGN